MSVWVEIGAFKTFDVALKVTLHVSVWVEIIHADQSDLYTERHAPRERVSWNFDFFVLSLKYGCHAPRERVSWNKKYWTALKLNHVTLHVSVWVEMASPIKFLYQSWVTLHVSVWVEIKSLSLKFEHFIVTLHVSVWVEIFTWFICLFAKIVTLHVSVWVEMLVAL